MRSRLSLAAGSTAPAAGAPAEPGRPAEASPGAHSIGDSLFPDIGNGGYNVKHYSPADYARDRPDLRGLARRHVGDRDFNTIMKRWASLQRGKAVSTAQFVALAEQVSDRNLGAFFHSWLYVAKRPDRLSRAEAQAVQAGRWA